MSILSDHELADLITKGGIIRALGHDSQDATRDKITKVDEKPILSYGLGSYGYDLRLGNDFLMLKTGIVGSIDPKDFSPHLMDRKFIKDHEAMTIPPRGFVLGVSKEYLTIPRDCMCICVGKSTYARCGILTYVTPLEPEWHGHVTIEISNFTHYPALVYAGEGICQVLFLKGNETCEVSYADRDGKYQGQTGVQIAKP